MVSTKIMTIQMHEVSLDILYRTQWLTSFFYFLFPTAPWIFSSFYNLVRPLLSKHTIEKINIFDSNSSKWKPILTQKLPPESVPEEYGGTAEAVLTCYKDKEQETLND